MEAEKLTAYHAELSSKAASRGGKRSRGGLGTGLQGSGGFDLNRAILAKAGLLTAEQAEEEERKRASMPLIRFVKAGSAGAAKEVAPPSDTHTRFSDSDESDDEEGASEAAEEPAKRRKHLHAELRQILASCHADCTQ